MGMYSFFEEEDIKVTDEEGLKQFLKDYRQYYPDSFIFQKDSEGKECFNVINEKGEFTFSNWDNIKLISYWYDDELAFLDLVAQYIEGFVRWQFENDDESGWVEFKDGDCIIHTGQRMNWNEWKPEGGYRKGSEDFNKLPKEIQRLIMLKRLNK